MRWIVRMMAVVLVLALWIPAALAQDQQQRDRHAATSPMMEMMNDPLMNSAMMVHMLPTMRQQLDLSDDQVQGLRQIGDRYQEQRRDLSERMQRQTAQRNELTARPDADPEAVRQMLREGAETRTEMEALALETATEMRNTLSVEQRQRLQAIDVRQMHHHVMTNMTMMDMMQMMQGMMPECPMMDGMSGMGPGSMMGPHMMQHHNDAHH